MGKILVVEDNSVMLKAMLEVLRTAGHQAYGAVDWGECRGVLQSFTPELIIMDVNLEGTQGGDVLAFHLTKDPRTKDAKLVFHSALKEYDLQVLCKRLQAQGYICKSTIGAHWLGKINAFLLAAKKS